MERQQTAAAMTELRSRGYEPMDDPVEELLRLASEAVAFKDILAERVAVLTELSSVDRTGQETISAVLAAYAGALKEASAVLVQLNRLDIAARRVQVEAVQAGLLAEALKRAIWTPAADLTWDQGQAVLAAASDEFAALVA